MTVGTSSDPIDWAARAAALKASGDLAGAARAYEQAARVRPDSSVAEHNLASTLGDLGDFAAAAEASARAFAKGGDAPETWLVHARALQGLGQLDDADRAFEQALRRRPAYAVAHRDLAQLRWMRTADPAAAMRALDAAPDTPDLALVRATVLAAIGRADHARQVVQTALARGGAIPALHLMAAGLAGRTGDAPAQLHHATAALRAAPASADAARAAVEALIHLDRGGEAASLAERVVAAEPDNQAALSLLATAWRLTGDPRHRALAEDPALVSAGLIACPAGWSDLDAFLSELSAALAALHGWRTHPLEQSLRHGSQTQVDLTRLETPVIRALFAALTTTLDTRLPALGHGDDPVRRRNTGRWRFAGAWSVRLMPGGFHTDHVHPAGWLSSAFYVALPKAVAREPEGWLAFGRPGIPTARPLPPFRRIRPEPGMLALFPSYLWHGTEPFTGDEPRITVAFDIVPA
ncbi:Flp pilus assembly protein TadD, contains TPR repeats [Sphingomonas gellani]|uniref:Flp pilus assembly protein TadD, contains TPR repeats n=1 Tax=Sphingomonas gellani TaxID=1166340 RepID=A0A1H8CTZ6_9SPHN|nr:2OG-Fe(II) oxygenase family protein [Sphingomonas gellani]SEM98466.1 Flp pilus assembly protein TadD, contains TPR repeats [Sphingomonas gellani]